MFSDGLWQPLWKGLSTPKRAAAHRLKTAELHPPTHHCFDFGYNVLQCRYFRFSLVELTSFFLLQTLGLSPV